MSDSRNIAVLEANKIARARFKGWQDHVEALLKASIHQDPYPEYESEMQSKILEIFYRNFKYFDGLPDFGDIIDDVLNYNDDILLMAAEIQFDADGYDFDRSLSREDGISEVHRMLWEFHNYDMFERVDQYVFNFLVSKNFSFLIPKSYYTHERFLTGIEGNIVVNDCSNLLFPEFLEAIEDEVTPFYPNGVSILTIWGE